MKIRNVMFCLYLVGAACTVQAQQSSPDMPGMPGMKMEPARRDSPPPSAPKQDPPKGSPGAVPPDILGMGHDGANRKAKAAAASVEQSVQQQVGQAQSKPGPDSDASSIKVPIQTLQEPEAIGLQTGFDLPVPELLAEVRARQAMTLEDFLKLADERNPTLAQAQRNVDRSNQQGRQVGLAPNPTVGYSGDHIRGGSYHGGEEGGFVSQEIVLGRKLALRRDVYRAEARSNEAGVEVQIARVHGEVARAFVDTLAAQETATVSERLLKVALDAETNSHELERVGQADATDVLNAEVSAEQAKVEFVEAQRTFLSAFAQLAISAGQSALAPHPVEGNFIEPPQLDAEHLVLTDVQDSPLVKQAQANVTVAEARARSARRESVPNLNVKAGEWYSGEELGATTKKAGFESFVEAGVQVPLWNRNQGNIEAAKVELERARQDITRAQLVVRNRAEPLAQQYETARYTADKYRAEMLPRARRAYQLEAMKYQQMAQGYPHVLAAQRMLFTLQLGYIRAIHDQWRAAIALQNYTLMNGLDAPESVGQDSSAMNLPTASGGSH